MRKQAGFNLIELLVVVAIIGILGSIGYSSYQGYMVNARRDAAMSELMQIATSQEKIYLDDNSYTNNLAKLGTGSTTADGLYTITVSTSNNGQNFDVTATPVTGGAQAGDTECSPLKIDNQNRKKPSTCW